MVRAVSFVVPVHPARRRGFSRGFTLVELLVVVVIIGVFAAIGVVLMREYIFTAKTTEAFAVVQSIRAAEENWKAQSGSYLNVSETLDPANYYPSEAQGRTKRSFYRTSTSLLDKRWKLLNPTISMQVQFGYLVVAGAAGEALPALGTARQPTWPTPIESWYVVQARGDKDQDGHYSFFAASSFTPEIYTENPDE